MGQSGFSWTTTICLQDAQMVKTGAPFNVVLRVMLIVKQCSHCSAVVLWRCPPFCSHWVEDSSTLFCKTCLDFVLWKHITPFEK